MSDDQDVTTAGGTDDPENLASQEERDRLTAEVAAESGEQPEPAAEAEPVEAPRDESVEDPDDESIYGDVLGDQSAEEAAPGAAPAYAAAQGQTMAATATMEQAVTEASPVRFPEVSGGMGRADLPLDRIYDLKVPVSVELGKSTLSVHEILQLAPGSVVELDNTADAPISMYVHGKRVAMGEIVVVDEYYGVKITSVG